MAYEELIEYFRAHQAQDLSYSMVLGEGEQEYMFVGAMHGNEPAGVRAQIKYHQFLKQNEVLLNARVRFVLANYQALENNVRYNAADMNRLFSDPIIGESFEARRAREISAFLKKSNITAVVDFHSVSKGDVQMSAYTAEIARSNPEEISHLPLHFVFEDHQVPGSLIGYATKLGIHAIAHECGNHTGDESAARAYDLVTRTLLQFGVAKPEDLPATMQEELEEIVQYRVITPIPVGEGFRFDNSHVQTDEFIPKGARFASDRTYGVHTAPQDCYVVMPSKEPKPTDKDAGFLCEKKVLRRQ